MILKADPKHVEARYNYSLDLLRMNRVREALPLFQLRLEAYL